jgi:hypothetical protein
MGGALGILYCQFTPFWSMSSISLGHLLISMPEIGSHLPTSVSASERPRTYSCSSDDFKSSANDDVVQAFQPSRAAPACIFFCACRSFSIRSITISFTSRHGRDTTPCTLFPLRHAWDVSVIIPPGMPSALSDSSALASSLPVRSIFSG